MNHVGSDEPQAAEKTGDILAEAFTERALAKQRLLDLHDRFDVPLGAGRQDRFAFAHRRPC